jgi:hypothetical protein
LREQFESGRRVYWGQGQTIERSLRTRERGTKMIGYRPGTMSNTIRQTAELYDRACNRAWLRRIWAVLTRRPYRLLDLAAVQAKCEVRQRYQDGKQTVPIRQIRGSEGRSSDFDAEFRPLKGHGSRRWIGIALARHQGKALPPVELIQVGDVYFVRDGHHRISVARAFGQQDIEAEVTVWQIQAPANEPTPWERRATGQNVTSREIGSGQLHPGLRSRLAAAWVGLRAWVVSHADAGA